MPKPKSHLEHCGLHEIGIADSISLTNYEHFRSVIFDLLQKNLGNINSCMFSPSLSLKWELGVCLEKNISPCYQWNINPHRLYYNNNNNLIDKTWLLEDR